jgi:hypothetical protein
MERPFALAVKCYGGFVLISDRPPGGVERTRLWPISTEAAAISHGLLPTAHEVGQAVISNHGATEPIDTIFVRASDQLSQHCAQHAVNQPVGVIFAGFDADRKQRLLGWYWNGNTFTTQDFSMGTFMQGVGNPIAQYLIAKLYSFDLSEELTSRLALYALVQSRTLLPYPIDEFAEIGWLRSSVGLELISEAYIRERLDLVQKKSEELRLRCQEFLAKEQP